MGKGFRWLGAVVLTIGAAAAVTVACSDTKQKGGLMLAINTDMRAPKDVNVITLSVLVNNQVKVNYQGRVTPDGKVLLPATVALAEPSDANASIRIRVVAFQERRARVLRDVRTTIPSGGRIALLRLPLNFVEDGSGQGELPIGFVVDDKPISNTAPGGSTSSGSTSSGSTSGGGVDGGGTSSGGDLGTGGDFGSGEFNPYEVVSSSCPVDQTSINGECKDDYVDSSSLPDYSEELVGKGDDPASCFDVAKAFGAAAPVGQGQSGGDVTVDAGSGGGSDGADASIQVDAGSGGKDFHFQNVTLDTSACALNLNGADPNNLNIAIVTNDTGECIRPGECYIPIDEGEGGWTASGGRVTLPSFVCTLLTKKGLRLATAVGQPAKKVNNPICAATQEGPTNDAGPVAATRVIAEAFATSVRVPNIGSQGQVLYFAGANRVGSYMLTATSPPPTEITFPGTRPMGQLPWTLTPRTATAGFVLTTEASATAWFVATPDSTQMNAIPVGVSPINNGFDDGTGGFYWAIGGDTGGVYQSTTTEPTAAQRVTLPSGPFPSTDVVAVVPAASGGLSGFLYVDAAGNASACNGELGCSTPISLGSRADDFAVDPRTAPSGSSGASFVLTSTGIRQLAAGDLGPALGPVLDAQTAGIQQQGGYFRHGITTANNHGCLYFTSSRGVEWATLDFSQRGVLVPLPETTPALGIAAGGRDNGKSGSFLFFAVYASDADGGGIWQVPPPPECPVEQGGGDGGVGGNDASAADDAGTQCLPSGDCNPPGPNPRCCSGTCLDTFVCAAP